MIQLLFILGCTLITNAWATPDSFEFWFLSPQKTALMKYEDQTTFSKKIVSNEDKKCVAKMGEDCFDPQYGVFPDPALEKLKEDITKKKKEKKPEPTDNYLSDMEKAQFECDKNQSFDIYCGGKVKTETEKKSKLEVWIDTGRSMADVDYEDKNKDCYRKSFIKRLNTSCTHVDVYTFNSFLKYNPGLNDLCDTAGYTDQNRVLAWLNESKAKKVIIITSKAMISKGVADYIVTHGGKSKGEAVQKELDGKDLLELVDTAKKFCH